MSDMNFICPTCKRPTHPTDNEIIEHLAKEIDRYTEVLIIRTKELDRTRKMLKIAIGAIETIKYSKKSDAINLRHKANKALIEIYKIKDQPALKQKDK